MPSAVLSIAGRELGVTPALPAPVSVSTWAALSEM
jgi:hypothetical protein